MQFFGEFPGLDAFPYSDAEVVDAKDLAWLKKTCLERGHGGFSIQDGKAYFKKESTDACIKQLADAPTATFFASPHRDGSAYVRVKVVSYNMLWEAIAGQASEASAARLHGASGLVASAKPDLIGLQECEDITHVLREGGLAGDFEAIQGPHGLATAFRSADWSLLAEGAAEVAVDEVKAFRSARSVHWARLQHRQTGKVVLFLNHQGPLGVNSGGRGGSHSTALAIMNCASENHVVGDKIILLGDFRATASSETVRCLEHAYPKAFSGTAQGGVDHVFSTLHAVHREAKSAGGSDHDLLSVTFVA